MEGRLAGSMNLADVDIERYTPEMDSFFVSIERESLPVSECGRRPRACGFLATRDLLTRLRNRRELDDTLEREIQPCHPTR